MTISYRFEVNGNILFVTTSGFDGDLEEVFAYNDAVVKAGLENDCKRILCDERNLEYRLGLVDTYALAEYAAKKAPFLVRVAIIHRPEDAQEAEFYETVATNRGLAVRIFNDFDAALTWIKED